ncbi:MAG: RidA family protein [Alphaproteobacteria bacterium]
MLKFINPPTLAPSFSNYSQAVLIPKNAETLFVSGQLGIDKEGVIAVGFEAQLIQAMANLQLVLADVGMSLNDIVKLTVYSAVDTNEAIESYRKVRDETLVDHKPAALYATVTGFTHPEFLVEIEAVAAKA